MTAEMTMSFSSGAVLVGPGGLSRGQSWHGVAIRGRPRDAGAPPFRCLEGITATWDRPRVSDRRRRSRSGTCGRDHSQA